MSFSFIFRGVVLVDSSSKQKSWSTLYCNKRKKKTNCKVVVLLEQIRVINKFSGCCVYVISRQGIEQLEFSSSLLWKSKRVITCRILPVSASSPEKCTCISSCSSNMITKQAAISKWLASLKQFLPCSHVLASWRSFTPVGQAHKWPFLFNKHKWLHPPLVLELHGLSPVISRQSSYLKMVKFQTFMNPWMSG